MIVIGCRYEDVYDGFLAGFYVCECSDVSAYVYFYEYVDIFEVHEAVFSVVFPGTCVQNQRKLCLFLIIKLY